VGKEAGHSGETDESEENTLFFGHFSPAVPADRRLESGTLQLRGN
jgi:hypothetical protein